VSDKNKETEMLRCSCGKYEKCTRKIQTSWNNRWGTGRIWIDKKDQYRCG